MSTPLDQITDNVYHIGEVDAPPPLFQFLTESLALFNVGTATVIEVEAERIEMISLLPDFKNSYEHSPLLFRGLLEDNLTAIDALGHGSLPLTLDLAHSVNIVDKRFALDAYDVSLLNTLTRFDQTAEPAPLFLTQLQNGTVTKADISLFIHSAPVVMEDTSDRELYQALLDTQTAADKYFPLKSLQDLVLEVKFANTSTDLFLAATSITVSDVQTELDAFLTSITDYDTTLNTLIDHNTTSLSYAPLVAADLSLITTDEVSALIERGFTVAYVINNSAQNFTVDDTSIRDALIIENLELEKTMNSMVVALNSNGIYQEYLNNYQSIVAETTTLDEKALELETLTTQVNQATIDINGGAPVNEFTLITLASDVDRAVSDSKDSAARLDTLAKQNSEIGIKQNQISSDTPRTSIRHASALDAKLNATQASLGLSDALLLASQSNISNMSSKMSDALNGVTLLAVAASLSANPSETVRSAFNLLAAPLEASLLIVNAALCTLKAAKCALCLVVRGIESAISALGKLVQKAADFLNRDSIYGDLVDDIKDAISDGYNALMGGEICSLVQARNQLDNDAIRAALEGTGLNDLAGSTALRDKQTAWNSAVASVCGGHSSSLPTGLLTIIKDEFDAFLDNIKASVENTVSNFYALASGCDNCSKDLDLGIDINFPEIKGINTTFPSAVISIPYLDSKVIKC